MLIPLEGFTVSSWDLTRAKQTQGAGEDAAFLQTPPTAKPKQKTQRKMEQKSWSYQGEKNHIWHIPTESPRKKTTQKSVVGKPWEQLAAGGRPSCSSSAGRAAGGPQPIPSRGAPARGSRRGDTSTTRLRRGAGLEMNSLLSQNTLSGREGSGEGGLNMSR